MYSIGNNGLERAAANLIPCSKTIKVTLRTIKSGFTVYAHSWQTVTIMKCSPQSNEIFK